jgi:hypothetical protein
MWNSPILPGSLTAAVDLNFSNPLSTLQMPAAPSEPEKYSIDEMMDRLKNAPQGNAASGELVTCADGTQAIRTRVRKRRTSQTPKKPAQKIRRFHIILVVLGVILVLLAGLGIGAGILYVNSSGFRNKLIRDIEQDSGATADLWQFRMNPKTANAAQLSLSWPEGSLLKTLDLGNLTAEIFPTSFIGMPLNGEEISMSSGALNLQFPKSGSLRNPLAPSAEKAAIQFKRYRTRQLDMTFGDPLQPLIRLAKTEASLDSKSVSGPPQLSLYQGKIDMVGMPKLRLDRALVEFTREEMKFITLRVLHEKDETGSLALTGVIKPFNSQQPASLAVRLDAFDLSAIVGPELGRLISGKINSVPAEGSNKLSFTTAGDSPAKLEITFSEAAAAPISLQRMPFLEMLAKNARYPWLESPTFETRASGVLHRESGAVSLRNLNLVSSGRMAIQGELVMDAAQNLSGNLRVGVADAIWAVSGESRVRSLFGPQEDGFRWITLKLGGTATQPADNLHEMMNSSTAGDSLTPSENENPGATFEQLTRPR